MHLWNRKSRVLHHDKNLAIISFPGSAWERTAARLCLDADEAEPRGSVVPGGAWDQGMGARCCEGVNAPLVMN